MVQTTFLYYLTRVAHYQSLSIAAQELHVSQPALSQGIKTLEKQLGVKLLERTYKGVTLTKEGKEVVALAEKAFGYLDEIERKYITEKEPESDISIEDLVIYCNPAYSPKAMSALSSDKHTDIHLIQLYDLTPDIDVQQLLRSSTNTVVLGIVSDTHELANDITSIKLCSSQAYIMCTPDFSYIAPDKSTISFKELSHVPLSILNNPFEFQKILLNGIQQYGKPYIKVCSPNVSTVSSAVYNGVAASFCNKFFRSSADESMRYLPIRNSPKFHLSLVANGKIEQNKFNYLAKLLKQHLL